MRLKILGRSLRLIEVFGPKQKGTVGGLVEKNLVMLGEPYKIFLKDFKSHVRNDSGTWKGVIGRYCDADVNVNRAPPPVLCSNTALRIKNTFFQHSDLHKYIWCKDSLGQPSINDFCIVWAKCLLPCHLSAEGKRARKWSNDCFLSLDLEDFVAFALIVLRRKQTPPQ